MSLNDQFEYGRIPLKPLPYRNKELAQCNELIIDYGENATYHIYIADSNDPTKLIDITSKIITEILPNAKIDANQFQILIDGIKDPTSLQDIINFIYKRFAYADNLDGFIYDRDIDKVLSPNAKSVILQNTDGTVLLPITLASNIYDDSGNTIQDRLNNMTRVGFGSTYVRATEDNQIQFEFEYPFENYSDYMEVRIGTVYIDKSRYYVTPDKDVDGNYTKATLTFINSGPNEAIEKGRRIDILFIYNALAKTSSKYEYMYGGNIADKSVTANKLEKISDSYLLNDPSSIASSAALYNLFNEVINNVSNNLDNIIWGIDTSTSNSTIIVNINKDLLNKDTTKFFMSNIIIKNNKKSSASLKISDGTSTITYGIKMPDGSSLTRGFGSNKTITLLCDNTNSIAYLISVNNIKTSRFVYNCKDKDTVISYNGLDHNIGDIVNVYRNGVRLFSDIDYSDDTINESITLFVRTEEGERIVFESISY